MKVCPTCGGEFSDDTLFCPRDATSLRSTGKSDIVGSVVAGRYRIDRKLGEGGMGAVYLGEHVKMGRRSAIKVMAQSMVHDPEAIARFNREAANAARINHPNVCGIYDFGETEDGLIYLAMEFIEGEALTDLVDREQVLDPHRATRILTQTADALQAAHDLGIVHRDLKPDNIMLARGRDGADVVKVVDFGIAKAMTGDEGQKVTKTGLVVGTPEYMSPEQLSGDQLDGRSDIYSLALVYYRMLTGALPFQADTAQETMIKRLIEDPLPLAVALPGGQFPPALQQVMDRALARMPADRYASATAFARDAAEAIRGMPAAAAAAPEGATQLLDSAAITDAAGLTAQMTPTRVAGSRAPTPDTPAPAPATRQQAASAPTAPAPAATRKPVLAAAGVAVVAIGITAAVLLRGGAAPANVPAPQTNPDSGVSGSTAENNQPVDNSRQVQAPAGGNSTPSGPTTPAQQPEQRPEQETTRGIQPPAIDTAALRNELNSMLDLIIEADTRDAARVRAEAIFNNAAVPADLRALAAENVSQAFSEERRTSDACSWIDRAISTGGVTNARSRIRTQLGCQ